jgi:SPP1 gp7 family putative phage head morphogenesis protein
MSVSKSLGALDTKSDLFSVRNVTARDWSAREAGRLISKTSDTTKNEIRDIVTNGVENGHSYQKIAKAIRDKYKDSGEFSGVNKAPKHLRTRADLIASTEMGNAYEQGKREVMNRVSRTTPMEKKWLAVGDERTSDECRANDAQDWIGNDERFNSGHDCPLEHPGCRCTLTYRVA